MSPTRNSGRDKFKEILPPSSQPAGLRNAMAGARLMTEAFWEDSQPSTWRGRQIERKSKFDRALSLIINSLPEEARVEILKQLQASIDEIIKAEEDARLSSATGKRFTSKATLAQNVANEVQRQNDAVMDRLRRQAEEGLEEDIKAGRLLAPADMINRLKISKQALSAAVKSQRMFALSGPSGENYYPAFFCELTYERRSLERVSKALGSLPGGSKWQFFTTSKTSLGGQTPLAALKKGKLDDVLAAAEAFMDD